MAIYAPMHSRWWMMGEYLYQWGKWDLSLCQGLNCMQGNYSWKEVASNLVRWSYCSEANGSILVWKVIILLMAQYWSGR